MGIDGIGGKPPIGPGVGAVDSPSPRGQEFSLERSGAASSSQASADVSATDALDRFHAGELSLDEYMDTRVDKAVAHLAELLPPDQLDLLREQLKEQMQNDPSIGAMVQRVTGVAPSAAELDDNE
jgi:hypothetical protein